MAKPSYEILEAKLEASQLRHTVNELRNVIEQMQLELRESNRLLLKQNLPKRPYTTSTERMLIAAKQNWLCAGEDCPLSKITPNATFDTSLFTIDHSIPYSASGRHLNNRTALCPVCNSRKLQVEIAERRHRRPSHSSSDSE